VHDTTADGQPCARAEREAEQNVSVQVTFADASIRARAARAAGCAPLLAGERVLVCGDAGGGAGSGAVLRRLATALGAKVGSHGSGGSLWAAAGACTQCGVAAGASPPLAHGTRPCERLCA